MAGLRTPVKKAFKRAAGAGAALVMAGTLVFSGCAKPQVALVEAFARELNERHGIETGALTAKRDTIELHVFGYRESVGTVEVHRVKSRGGWTLGFEPSSAESFDYPRFDTHAFKRKIQAALNASALKGKFDSLGVRFEGLGAPDSFFYLISREQADSATRTSDYARIPVFGRRRADAKFSFPAKPVVRPQWRLPRKTPGGR